MKCVEGRQGQSKAAEGGDQEDEDICSLQQLCISRKKWLVSSEMVPLQPRSITVFPSQHFIISIFKYTAEEGELNRERYRPGTSFYH